MSTPIYLNHIKKVLQSQYSVYQIHRETNVSQSELTALRNHKSSPINIRIANGSKLEKFYLKHHNEIRNGVPERQQKRLMYLKRRKIKRKTRKNES